MVDGQALVHQIGFGAGRPLTLVAYDMGAFGEFEHCLEDAFKFSPGKTKRRTHL